MRQIRARIREKRGVDYTEDEIRELANVKLEKFLDPKGVRSDLLEQFRRHRERRAAAAELRVRATTTLYETHRGRSAGCAQLLQPVPEAVLQPEPADPGAAHPGGAERPQRRSASARSSTRLYYEVMHNLVVELTRTGHRGAEPEDARSSRCRAGSTSTSGARARSKGVVQYRAGAVPPLQPPPASQDQGRRDQRPQQGRPIRAAAISGRRIRAAAIRIARSAVSASARRARAARQARAASRRRGRRRRGRGRRRAPVEATRSTRTATSAARRRRRAAAGAGDGRRRGRRGAGAAPARRSAAPTATRRQPREASARRRATVRVRGRRGRAVRRR